MTEFPALRDALVAAGLRRRRRHRAVSAAFPALAVAAAAVAFVSFPASTPDREDAAPAPKSALQRAYAIFRRPQTARDVLPKDPLLGQADRAKSRLLGSSGGIEIYAVPAVLHGVAQLCIVEVRGSSSGAGCSALRGGGIREGFAPGVSSSDQFAVLLRDGTRDVVLTLQDGTRLTPAVRNNAIVLRTSTPVGATAWTGASGMRHISENEFVPKVPPPPSRCPAGLDPLPPDADARARRAVLLAVDRLYTGISAATVTGVTRAPVTPCGAAISARSVEVSLQLVPRDRGQRGDASLSQRRVLAGVQDGAMRVFYLLD